MTEIHGIPGSGPRLVPDAGPYAEAARKAARTDEFQRLNHELLAGLESVDYQAAGGSRSEIRPRLQPPPPRAGEDHLSAEGEFVRLIASLVELLGNSNLESLKNRLSMLRSMAHASQQALQRLSADYAEALAELVAAQGEVDTSQERLEALKARLDQAHGELEKAESHLASLSPSSPEYAAAKARRDQAKAAVDSLQQGFRQAADTHVQLLGSAKLAALRAEGLARQIQDKAAGRPVGDALEQQHLNAAGALALAMARLIELLGDAADRQLQADQELFLTMQAARQEFMRIKSEEYQEEVRKAEAAQKAMGCIGKILGWLVMAISAVVAVVSTVATLGAAAPAAGALVAAAIGIVGVLASLSDMIVKEATGNSFMEKAIKPVMEVFQKLVKLMADMYSEVLMAMGVPEDKAKIIGAIMGAIAAVVMVIAAAVVGIQAAGPVLGSVMNKVVEKLGDAFSRLVPELLKQGLNSVGKSLASLAEQLRGLLASSTDEVAISQLKNRLELLLAVVQTAGTATQSGLQIKNGIHQKQGAEHLADIRVSMAIVDALGGYLEEALETFARSIQNNDEQMKRFMARVQQDHGAALQVARNISLERR
ncbi:type III secretion system translocon subunit SctE [Pseudomonas vanderleydeniana]|uniref:Type III secretion system translocon subunit SctE n=1 Tax=Pseudomonas vanderleydeniana TaxID=2745495 RepID=A0A9E6TQ46_9PSED|nr:type III secretion system translocon subunit SctE [Pseudomonas vanderleydeniana]QXI27103.1 type III secretion system translocon subunit SctE [Pseudomonas vanderleydeniana]